MSRTLKILIVDDDELFRFNVRALLEDLGYNILEAENGCKALDICKTEKLDMVLSDLKMPEMDGLSLIDHMQKKYPEIPVIVISGAGTIDDAVKAVRTGAWDYITKPIKEADEIDIIICRTLERAKLKSENLRYREHLEELVKEQTYKLEARIAERDRLLALLHKIGKNVFIKTGQDYFKSMVCFISSQLNMEYALIGLLQSNQKQLKTIAVCCRESIVDNIEYDIKGTSFEEIIKKKTCFYAENIQTKYPDDKILGKIKAESYAGILLLTSTGIPLGLIAVTGSFPLKKEDKDTVISLLQIFGARCSAELQRLKAENDQKILENQLRQAQKMEAVGQLAGGIAHDFNNLLYVITGYTEIIMDHLSKESNLYQKAELILHTATRAAKLVRQLLLFSRREAMQTKPIDLNDLINNLMKMLKRIIGEHITLEVNTGYDLKKINGDPGQIEQVIMNLCVNAKDAVKDTGNICIETQNIIIDEDFCEIHPWSKPGQYVLLSISDNGGGVSNEIHDKIFEPFFTTKEVGKGTGLGLAAVYGIVKSHQALIHLYSEPGYGAAFKIYFPAIEETCQPDIDEQIQEIQTISKGSETVLIAEDEELVRSLIISILENSGYKVLPAQDGHEAALIFNNNINKIDIAILDIVMPKAGGMEVFDQIKIVRPDMPVIFMTGYSKGLLPVNFPPDTYYEILQKPLSCIDLLNKIRTMLDKINAA